MCLVWHGRSRAKHPQDWQSLHRSREAAMWPEEQTAASYTFKYQQQKPIKQGEQYWLGRGRNSREQNKQHRSWSSSVSSHGVGKVWLRPDWNSLQSTRKGLSSLHTDFLKTSYSLGDVFRDQKRGSARSGRQIKKVWTCKWLHRVSLLWFCLSLEHQAHCSHICYYLFWGFFLVWQSWMIFFLKNMFSQPVWLSWRFKLWKILQKIRAWKQQLR